MPQLRPVAALALAALALALAACQPEPAPTAAPPGATASARPTAATPSATPTATPSEARPGGDPTDSAEPEPTQTSRPAPAPTPTAGKPTLPADCTQAYSPAMQERLLAEFGALNPPGASRYPSSKIADLLDVIQGSPNLSCFWTPPGETGLMTNAAVIPAEHEQFVRDVLAANFPGCSETEEQPTCSRAAEQIEGAQETEYVVLRDHLMLTTLALNADTALVEAAVGDMLAAIAG